jgi:hypothetical protein
MFWRNSPGAFAQVATSGVERLTLFWAFVQKNRAEKVFLSMVFLWTHAVPWSKTALVGGNEAEDKPKKT